MSALQRSESVFIRGLKFGKRIDVPIRVSGRCTAGAPPGVRRLDGALDAVDWHGDVETSPVPHARQIRLLFGSEPTGSVEG